MACDRARDLNATEGATGNSRVTTPKKANTRAGKFDGAARRSAGAPRFGKESRVAAHCCLGRHKRPAPRSDSLSTARLTGRQPAQLGIFVGTLLLVPAVGWLRASGPPSKTDYNLILERD